MDTCIQLETACQEILKAYQEASSLESKVMIMTEFLAVKVTCHDVFIHGRSDLPSQHLFQMPFVCIEPKREIDYITRVLDSAPDEFRLKNILSYAMASGIDPVRSLSGSLNSKHRNRSTFTDLLKQLLERSGEVNAHSFFRWDIYGICNFIEGPVFLRKNNTRRCVSVLAEAWENYGWDQDKTCTQASDQFAREAFTIIFDHSKNIQSGSLQYFSDPVSREKNLRIIQDAEIKLIELFNQGRTHPIQG
jgi:hypothetical protein